MEKKASTGSKPRTTIFEVLLNANDMAGPLGYYQMISSGLNCFFIDQIRLLVVRFHLFFELKYPSANIMVKMARIRMIADRANGDVRSKGD